MANYDIFKNSYLYQKKIGGVWKWLQFHVVVQIYTKNAFVDVSNYTDEVEGYIDGWIKYETR